MRTIFEQGEFSKYKVSNLQESTSFGYETIYKFAQTETTVFISHKHDDLEDLKGIIGFLEKEYKIKVYIDSKDTTMPQKTSGVTATKIKDRIQKCDKFILLATNGAIDSKWCNWELGYGDAQKYEKKKIALFPMKPYGTYDSSYKGNEYMSIYPYIAYSNGEERLKNGEPIPKGYYVCTEQENGSINIESLQDWLKKK